MEKVYGSPKRQDGLYKVGRNKYELIYGFGEDENGGWNYRQRFNYLPSLNEIKQVIEAQINSNTDARILTQFAWNGKSVWLSQENQINLKAAYDMARDTAGETLPKRFKLGENEDGSPVYHTFTKVDAFADFIQKMLEHINKAVNDGYKEKDSINYSVFEV